MNAEKFKKQTMCPKIYIFSTHLLCFVFWFPMIFLFECMILFRSYSSCSTTHSCCEIQQIILKYIIMGILHKNNYIVFYTEINYKNHGFLHKINM